MNLRTDGDALLIDVLVQPRASRARIGPTRQDRLVLAVTAPPVGGQANRAVVDLVARALDLARSVAVPVAVPVPVGVTGVTGRIATAVVRPATAPARRQCGNRDGPQPPSSGFHCSAPVLRSAMVRNVIDTNGATSAIRGNP